ncbi:hypothetical protein VTN02DRAFT_4747 [Thermoascus thermophilus]
MATNISPLQRAFNNFLTTIPPKELEELVEYLHGLSAEGKNPIRPHAEGVLATMASLDNNSRRPTSAVDAGVRPIPSRGKRFREGKLRPLNSFIAFRSFYSAIFPDLTQKAKSGILKFLWQNDPFKAKWAILAKAYSIVRDDHVGQVSLDSFLSLNGHFIGILEPACYLAAMGWELTVNEQHQYTMVRVNPTYPTETEAATNYSVNDIVNRCYATGYVSGNSRPCDTKYQGTSHLMAFATQPSAAVNNNSDIQDTGNNGIMDDRNNTNMDDKENSDVEVISHAAFIPSEVTRAGTDEARPTITELLGVRRGPRTQEEFIAELDDAINELHVPDLNDDDLFAPFNPAIQSPILRYDPIAQEPFDAFNIDEFVNI